MFRRPVFWLVLSLVSIGGALFTFKYFSEAFPIVNLDIRMDRETALKSASDLAQKQKWKPEGYRQAATFSLDQEVQNFVELEAGGREAFSKMLREGLYSPYTWRVRHFKEGETREATIRFTPKGEPYGFVQKLPESEPGASLSSDSARAIAERAAVEDWKINLNDYQLLEKSQEVRPGGRTDHTFVYERPNIRVGEGYYRLRLIVGGDSLTELTHFVKIPEAFSRRYQEMRSANTSINAASSFAFVVLYLVGCCGIGLFFLLRQRWVIWRKPLFWGLFISSLQVLVGINQWPLAWMDYDTALSARGFLLQQIVFLLGEFVVLGLLLTLSFMAAESLSRRAFPHHIQMWRLWSPGVANSEAILGRTTGGYLLVGLFFAYEVVLYFFANRVLGWWTPSDALVDPNVLATYLPWFSSIAVSLQAGFWEESLFRAVPIATAALLGQRFGRRRAFIAVAMIIQALVFGAGHAGYANQPAYARVVELIIPSFSFGFIYIYFGLLPSIILHFTFDTVWFALPLFLSSSRGIWIDQAMVVLLVFVPLWVVLVARLRSKSWGEVSEGYYNRSWAPPVKEEAKPVVAEVAEPVSISSKRGLVLLVGGLLGLVVWFLTAGFRSDAPRLTIVRSGAQTLARKALSERAIELPAPWRVLDTVEAEPDEEDRFVWQECGKETYKKLLGTYLTPPHWKIRFARFEGDVAERAEEYQVFVSNDGRVYRVRHQLPEARPGESLTEDEARKLAHSALKENYQLEPSALKEISAKPSKLPARQDWELTFSEPVNYPLNGGEARISVKIAGNKVVDAYRYIHVPEEWSRKERDRRNLPRIIEILSDILIAILTIAGIIAAIVSWSRKSFSVRVFLSFFAFFSGTHVINLINGWPSVKARFSTAEPYLTQSILFFGFSLLGVLILSASLALVIGLVQNWVSQKSPIESSVDPKWGLYLGALVAGALALAAFFRPSLSPSWPTYNAVSNYVPVLGACLGSFTRYILQTTVLLLILVAVDRLTNGWRNRKALLAALLLFMGLILAGSRSVETIPFWLLLGLLIGVVLIGAYIFVLRFYPGLIPLALGVIIILSELKQGIYRAYPGAVPGVFLAVVLVGCFAFYLSKELTEAQRKASEVVDKV